MHISKQLEHSYCLQNWTYLVSFFVSVWLGAVWLGVIKPKQTLYPLTHGYYILQYTARMPFIEPIAVLYEDTKDER